MSDKAQMQYDAALKRLTAESSQVWARFTAMFYVNGGNLALVGLCLTSDKLHPAAGIAFCGVGLVTCFLWWGLMTRGFCYQNFWLACAREQEKAIGISLLIRGRALQNGETIQVDGEPHKLPRLRAEGLSRSTVVCVGLLYCIGIVLSCLRQCG